MSKHRNCGCTEYREVSRRDFMKLGFGATVAAAAPAWLPRVALAGSFASDRDVIVSIFLRGGVDGLSMVPPFTEQAYYDLRPGIAISPPDAASGAALDLDGTFGFAPAMKPLLEAYESGDLLVVHACGLETPTRSHFEAQHYVEVGQGEPPATLFSGWLGRHLAGTTPADPGAILRAVGVGYGLQRTLAGAPQALPIKDLASFGFAGAPATATAREMAVEAMYAAYEPPLETAAVATVQTIDLLEQIDIAGYRPQGGAEYPADDFGTALVSTAALIKADIGVEAVAIDLGGWDTHDNQGPLDGWMATLMTGLAEGLAAFHADLAAGGVSNFTVVAMSEFGRNARENGSSGSDHGHAGVMLALGNGIAGGRVLTDWPGLGDAQLYDGQDLAITIDYRDVITEILTARAGNTNPASIFPDATYRPKNWGVVR